jgi:transglycosylase-like protein with SLT domain
MDATSTRRYFWPAVIRWRTSQRALLLAFAIQLALPALLSAQAPRFSSSEPRSVFDLVGAAFNLDPALLRAIASVESGGHAQAVSPKGASGLMQLMPDTARRFGVRDVFNPVENLIGAARFLAYLRQYAEIEDLPELLAAYNAGEGAVEHYGGIPPYVETHQYVRRVLLTYLLGDEPLASQAFRAGPSDLSTSKASGQPSLVHSHSIARMAQAQTASNRVQFVAPETATPVTDADILARLEQIRHARRAAARSRRAPEQLP